MDETFFNISTSYPFKIKLSLRIFVTHYPFWTMSFLFIFSRRRILKMSNEVSEGEKWFRLFNMTFSKKI